VKKDQTDCVISAAKGADVRTYFGPASRPLRAPGARDLTGYAAALTGYARM
jgi:hypothetical protein